MTWTSREKLSRLGEKVDGLILVYEDENYRIPQLVSRQVMRTPTPGLYSDAHGTYVLGETFFIHEYPAYLKLRAVLRDQKSAHLLRVGVIERELENVQAIITSLSSEVKGE